jgi:hypothetical protein
LALSHEAVSAALAYAAQVIASAPTTSVNVTTDSAVSVSCDTAGPRSLGRLAAAASLALFRRRSLRG